MEKEALYRVWEHGQTSCGEYYTCPVSDFVMLEEAERILREKAEQWPCCSYEISFKENAIRV